MPKKAASKTVSKSVASASNVKNGPAAAALLAGGIAAVVYGIIIILSEGIAAVATALNWYNPAGPLSGKTTLAVIVWLVIWAVLGNQWKDKDVDFPRMANTALILLVVGVLLTVPPVFDTIIHLFGAG
jgi:hypothetical protein